MTNEDMDSQVLALIRSGVARAGFIRDRLIGVSMRDVDKSLQRLRRRGFIEYGAASRDVTFFGWRVKVS
jgi:Mn-dependent DtxR family transcriptional regulator